MKNSSLAIVLRAPASVRWSIRKCLSLALNPIGADRLDSLLDCRRLKHHHYLYRAGDKVEAIYIVRSGTFKTNLPGDNGAEQITGFQMKGDILGLDGIGTDFHACNAAALEDSEVSVLPCTLLESLIHEVESMQKQFHKIMSHEIVRDQKMLGLLRSMRAEERAAAFILDISQRMRAPGRGSSEFYLRMTREEIGSYLGVTLETVSRAFSQFQESGLISVHNKRVSILDQQGLRDLLGRFH